jgi:hypothetical protein
MSIYEYVSGATKSVKYIDGEYIKVYIPPFQKNLYEIHGKGVKNGSFIINLNMKYIEKDRWDTLNEKDKAEMIRVLGLCTQFDEK